MYERTRPRLLALIILVIAFATAGILTLRDVRLASSQTVTLVARRSEAPIPLDDPSAGVWDSGSPVALPLSAQNQVPPMGGGGGTVTARALHDGARLYIRLQWKDDAEDALTVGQTAFSDAGAVQFPVAQGEQVPAFCMGDPNAPVNIWQWKASWQAGVDGRLADVQDVFPNTVVDTYPFEDDEVFYPPQAAGNVAARVDRTTPIDNLLAGSFGTITPATDQMVQGRGEWGDGRWSVVFARDLAVAGDYTQFEVGARTNIAFAVWDGDRGERDGMKSVSPLLTLDISPEIAEPGGGINISRGAVAAIIGAGVALALLLGLGLDRYARRRGA